MNEYNAQADVQSSKEENDSEVFEDIHFYQKKSLDTEAAKYKEIQLANSSVAHTRTVESERSQQSSVNGNGTSATIEIDEAIKSMGGFSNYQYCIVVTQTFNMIMGSYAAYPMGFYELLPTYECLYFDEARDGWSTQWQQCTNRDFCHNLGASNNGTGQLPQYRVVEDSADSLKNWVGQFGLHCATKNQWGLFGSLYFSGMVVGTLIQPRLSDHYGRKPFAIGSALVHAAMALIMIVTTESKLAEICVFIQGFCMPGRVFVGYAWMIGQICDADVPMATAVMFSCDASVIFVSSIFFQYISKDWRWLMLTATIILTLNSINYCRLPESPKFHHGLERFDKAREVLTSIGRRNKVLSATESFTKLFPEEIKSKLNGTQKSEGMNPKDAPEQQEADISVRLFLSQMVNLKNTLFFIVMSIACSFIYYIINFYVKYLPGSIYTNQICNSMADMMGDLTSMVVVRYTSHKTGFIFSYSICAIACILISWSTMGDVDTADVPSWITPLGVLGAKFGISSSYSIFYFATVYYFEPQYHGFVMGASNFLARFATIGAPVIAEQQPPLPMMTSIFLVILAIMATAGMKRPQSLQARAKL